MLKKVFFSVSTRMLDLKRLASFIIAIVSCGAATAQTDSTDLDLFMTDAVLVTALDTMLYGDGTYDKLNLDFTISDTVTFNKVHISLEETGTATVIFKKGYTISDLTSESLLTGWDVSIPFGNLSNELGYIVAIIIEEYDGSLGATITKTLNP